MTWQQATHKVYSLNTIAALTFHINYYLDGINNVFAGGGLEIRDKYSYDLPPIESASDWDRLRQSLFDSAETFIQHVEHLSNDQLDATFVDEKYGTYRRNIEGVIEHAYYHLGQISLIRKLLGQ